MLTVRATTALSMSRRTRRAAIKEQAAIKAAIKAAR
jgi:hypothetical protein